MCIEVLRESTNTYVNDGSNFAPFDARRRRRNIRLSYLAKSDLKKHGESVRDNPADERRPLTNVNERSNVFEHRHHNYTGQDKTSTFIYIFYYKLIYKARHK